MLINFKPFPTNITIPIINISNQLPKINKMDTEIWTNFHFGKIDFNQFTVWNTRQAIVNLKRCSQLDFWRYTTEQIQGENLCLWKMLKVILSSMMSDDSFRISLESVVLVKIVSIHFQKQVACEIIKEFIMEMSHILVNNVQRHFWKFVDWEITIF